MSRTSTIKFYVELKCPPCIVVFVADVTHIISSDLVGSNVIKFQENKSYELFP